MFVASRLALFAALCLSLTLAACGKTDGAAASQPAGPKPIPVTFLKARLVSVQRTVHIVGELAPLERVTLSNRVTGFVNAIYVDVGDQVLPFDPAKKIPLLTIEPKRYEMNLISARQELNEVLAKLGREERATNDTVISNDHPILDWAHVNPEATSPYKKAYSEYETAKKKLDQALPLYNQKLIHEFEFTDYENAVKVAESNLDTARNEARALMAQAQGLEATIQLRQKDYDDASVYPPGPVAPDKTPIKRYWVTKRTTSVADYLKEGTPLLTLEADEPIKLLARVPERELANIAVGDTTTFKNAAYPGVEFIGKVRVIDPMVDPLNRSVTVEIRVENKLPDNAPASLMTHHAERPLRSGQLVTGDILVQAAGKQTEDIICVPARSITTFVGENKIFVITESAGVTSVRQVAIDIGQQVAGKPGDLDAWVEINPKDPANTIKPGDRIVVDGVTKLIDKTVVTIAESAPVTIPSTTPAATPSSQPN